MAEDKFLLKVVVDWRRLHAHGFQTILFENSHLGAPIGSPTDSVEFNFAFVNFRSRVHVVDYARKHAICGGAGFDRGLTRARAIHSEVSNTVRQNRGETFR